MPSAMKIERVIHRLQKELNTLNGIDGLELDLAQNDGVETCRKQLLEDDSLEKRRRSERKKAKILLSKIYNVSPVLFVLFIISIPTYQWHLLEEKSTVPALRNWMESVTIPDRLRNEARKICDGFFDRLLNSKKTESGFIRRSRFSWKSRLIDVKSPQLKSANVKRAVGIIKGSSEKGDCATVIEENLTSWADIGRRLDTLCKDLNENNENNLGEDMHLGFLFRLPEYVTDRHLRKDIPLDGSKRTARVRRIQSDCIRTGAEYNDLDDIANKIFKSLWEPIQISMNSERFIHEGPTDVSSAERHYENVIREPPMAHGTSNDAVPMDEPGAQEWLPAPSQQTQNDTETTVNSPNPAEGPLHQRQAASQVSGQSGASEVVLPSRGMRSQQHVHPLTPHGMDFEGSCESQRDTEAFTLDYLQVAAVNMADQNGGSRRIPSATRNSLIEENATLPPMSNQSDPSQAGMVSGDFNLQPHSTYMPVPGPHMSDPTQLRITGNPPFQQLHMASARSDTQSDQSQMNITFDRFNPQPYLTYTPAPRPPDMSGSAQFGITRDLPFQQLHMTSASSDTQCGQSQMNITFDRFNPQPYLTYIPAAQPSALSNHQKPAGESGAYMVLHRQLEDIHDGQAERNGYQNEVQHRPEDQIRVWVNQSQDQMDHRTLQSGMNDPHRLETYPAAHQLVMMEA
ncbi:hypothetical protein KXW98_003781 [Aspergillus fumigatus]|nr:hypothetical protein KXX14_006772 [Aspergillus fumigatus]KAH1486650.1 hypothetical protein KXX42_004718 [Aspergillus fumigatus]KAH1544005.1 hypothetical protein KXX57_005629 [Aspergillus fumigatus]KAH1607972.1 hypothetical protein KXX44_008405 [Aspergillus fumigatus]KAH1746303.1 hypothetical protein KXX56_003727 [Aspergillus fumigatus]